jgi:hypothetical protein
VILIRNMCNLVRGAFILFKRFNVHTLYKLYVTIHVEVNSNNVTIENTQATKYLKELKNACFGR